MRYIKKIVSVFAITGTLIAVAAIFFLVHYSPESGSKAVRMGGKSPAARGGPSVSALANKRGQDLPRTSSQPDALQHEEEQHPQNQKIAIIIDDLGGDLKPVSELLQINAPVTFAVLPHCAHSAEAADLMHKAGKEILLHLPMEPRDYPDEKPGGGALFVQMGDGLIRRQIDDDIRSVPHIIGVNNHMGSRFMEDERKLSVVFQYLKNKRLFFVDSRTTPNSKGRQLAGHIGLPFASRNVFIDNDQSYAQTFRRITAVARQGIPERSAAIVLIGHPYPATIEALKKAIPILKSRGVEIVPISALVRSADQENSLTMR
jgi:polysaccharide deacetylase 2 family uncharacterized protein YibQ